MVYSRFHSGCFLFPLEKVKGELFRLPFFKSKVMKNAVAKNGNMELSRSCFLYNRGLKYFSQYEESGLARVSADIRYQALLNPPCST